MKRLFVTAGLVGALAVPAAVSAQTSGAGATQPKAADQATAKSAADAKLATTDRSFAMEAAMGGMAEVELGRLAADKAANADVKQFGQRMVDDHGKANEELKGWASQNSVTLPAKLDAKHQAIVDRLSKLSGAAFDKAYMQDMVADHNKDVAAFKRASTTAKNAELKAWAGKTLPTLEEHQKMAREINSKVAGGAAKK